MQSGFNGDSSSCQNCGAELTSSPELGEVRAAAQGSACVVCLWLCSVSRLNFCHVSLPLGHTSSSFFCHIYFPIYVQFTVHKPAGCVSRLCAVISSVIPFEFHFQHDHFLFLCCMSDVGGQSMRLWRMSHGSVCSRQEGGTAPASLPLRGLVGEAQ